MTNEPIDALLKTGGTPGGEAEEDDDDQNLMEEEASAHLFFIEKMSNLTLPPGGQVAAHQGPDELHARLERGNVPWIPSHCKP